MFFDDDEMKVAEDLAWKMLDGWNHAYCPNLSEYAHFYYKGKVILDPWMNEKSQGLPWPNHESKESAVDPIKYYGMDIHKRIKRNRSCLPLLCSSTRK